jgi:hypothetical protein
VKATTLILTAGAGVVAYVLLRPRLAEAAEGGAFGGGGAGGSIDSLITRYEGQTLGSVPRADQARLEAHAAAFDVAPPHGGLLGTVLVPMPPGFLFSVPFMVREKASERAKDLGAFHAWSTAPQTRIMMKNVVHGQALSFFDRAGGAVKGLANVGLGYATGGAVKI